jgi:hypothetical protein
VDTDPQMATVATIILKIVRSKHLKVSINLKTHIYKDVNWI